MEQVAQIFGLTFVGIILVCLVWTIIDYAYPKCKQNDKLIDNIGKLDKINGVGARKNTTR